MCRISLAFLLCIAAGFSQDAAPPRGELPTAKEIDSILRGLASITGFRVKKQLPFQMVTRDQVNKYLKDQIRHSVKPEEIRAEEATLKRFGFAPPEFDLKKTTIDLLTEQAAAFYDFRRKKLFISDWAAQNMREVALVHELAHALADQNFPIQKFLSRNSDDSEQSAARESVVEGQASWLMTEYAMRLTGRTLKDPATASEFLKDQSEDSDDDAFPVFSQAPLYLRRTLMFPYDEGEKFQQAVFLKDGQAAFSRLFQEPPVTTSQVMHPDRYFARVTSTTPALPKPLRHAKAFVSGTLGELDQSILLEQYLDAGVAGSLAPQLRGASYRIDEAKVSNRPGRRQMLVYVSEWADEQAAGRYFDAWQRILRGKLKQIQVNSDGANRFSGKSEDGYFLVTLNGNKVLSEEGFAEPLASGS